MKLSLSLNPVLVKEMRGRMRGPRAFLFLTGTLALFGVVMYGLYRLLRFVVGMQSGISTGAVIGQSLFSGLIFLATLVICAIAPALTAGAISGEHERKTFDLLLATPLKASSVLLGKLIAALSYVALILLAVAPVVSLAFVFGGIAFTDMLKSLMLLLGFALTYGMIGLFFSALLRRTGLAVAASYLVLALFVLGSVFVYAIVGVIRNSMPPSWILSLNPFSAIASALAAPMTTGNFSIGSVFGALAALIGGMGFEPSASFARPVWQMTLGIYAWLTVVLFLLTTQLVKPMRRFQPRRRTLTIGAVLLLVTVGAPPVIYGPLSLDRLVDWVRWLESAPHNLIVNGQFAGTLEPTWRRSSSVDRTKAAGTTHVQSDNDAGIRIEYTGDSSTVTSMTQMINQPVPVKGWLQVRVLMRINSASKEMCGPQGNECPLMLKLNYDGADGIPHEWMQGFHTGENYGYPTMCTTCENRPIHVAVKQGEWHTYESPNLLMTWPLQGVSFIRAITLSAAGESYDVEIKEVAMIAREGHPLDWSELGNPFATPTPVLLRGQVMPGGAMVPVAPLAPPPMAVPPMPPPATTSPVEPTPVATATRRVSPVPTGSNRSLPVPTPVTTQSPN